jgi:bacterial/archaeal transporter family-2 protein
MNKLIWIGLALLAGALLPIQAAFNTKLGKAINSPVHASMASFVIGAISIALYIFLSSQNVSFSGAKTAPGYVWVAGAFGAFYVTIIVMAFPRLGPALTFGLVIAGQMLISVLMDHLNILVTAHHPLSVQRFFGIALVIAGVILIRKF